MEIPVKMELPARIVEDITLLRKERDMNVHVELFTKRAATGFAILACFNTLGYAQLQTGSISGQITDPQGAVIANATVALVDQERNIERKAATSNIGFYIFPQVPAGIYTIRLQTPGFKPVEQKDIQLHVNQNLNVSLTLELSTTVQTATVSATVSQVDTEKSTVQETVDARQVTQMALNGRNVLQLQELVNGAVYTGAVDQQANTPGYQVNGANAFSNNYTLDGGENEDSFFNSPIPYPNPDALQEFTIQTSNYDAEYGGIVARRSTR
jgi:outer membrane receptor protein involved in Fe transport